jgi:phage baseplate assembly protein W
MPINPNSLYPRTLAVAGRIINILYLDVNSDYGLNNDQFLLENVFAINGQILNIILTPIGSSHFEPELGSNIPGMIFDLPSEFNNWAIEDELLLSMHRWLPVVQIDFTKSNIIAMDDVSESGYIFNLYYSVQGIGNPVSVDFRFST